MAEDSHSSPDEDKLSLSSRLDPPSGLAQPSQPRSDLSQLEDIVIKQFQNAEDASERQEHFERIREIRKMKQETTSEVRTTIASTFILGVGLFLAIGSSAPLFGTFLIILGAAKLLGISLSEMSGFLESFTNSVRNLSNWSDRDKKILPPRDRDDEE